MPRSSVPLRTLGLGVDGGVSASRATTPKLPEAQARTDTLKAARHAGRRSAIKHPGGREDLRLCYRP